MEGILNLNKVAGMSSARAVARIKPLLSRGTKIGHAGTLDPFATGVLILLIGNATRQCEQIMSWPKTYEATIKLGATTATDDPESPEEPRTTCNSPPPSCDEVESALRTFVGVIQQRPPIYSAVKIGGRRACDRARAGQAVEVKPRAVQVYSIELLDYTWPLLQVRIDCGRGTYIRSIARDLGELLRVGAYVAQLRRTRIGPCRIENALTLEQLTPQNIASLLHRATPSL
jgi:tRNA pseudouridine55 synthase